MSFSSDIQIVKRALLEFYGDSVFARKSVINQEGLAEITVDLGLAFYAENGGLTGNNLSLFLRKYLSYATRLHHPRYLGHQCAAPHYSSVLGAMVNSFTNNVASIYEMGPASVSIEYFLVNWMLEKAGWEKAPLNPATTAEKGTYGGGVLVDGGSIANLTALLFARSTVVPDVWENGNPSDLAILLPSESHYSLTKAAGILGIGAKSIYYLKIDDRGSIIPDKIPVMYQKLIDEGKRPIAMAANACSTAVGIYDPIDEIAEFCTANNLWLHIDGAHGASALLSHKHRGLLKGIEKADSLVWDAHKLLQTPSLCAALLVRNHKHMEQGFQLQKNASYLFHKKIQPGFDSIHRTIETTKSGLGEKLFFVLGALGEKGLMAFIDHQYEITLSAYLYIDKLDDFECPIRPESNILCFRCQLSDEEHLNIRNQLTIDGTFYITTVVFHKKRYFRLVFMSPSTTITHIKDLIANIRSIIGSSSNNTV